MNKEILIQENFFQTTSLCDDLNIEIENTIFNQESFSGNSFGIVKGVKIFEKREIRYDEDDKRYKIKSDQIRCVLHDVIKASTIEFAKEEFLKNKNCPHIVIDEFGVFHLILPLEVRSFFSNNGIFGNLNSIAIPKFGGVFIESVDFISICVSFLSKNGKFVNKTQISSYEKLLSILQGIFLRCENVLFKNLTSKDNTGSSFISSLTLKNIKLPSGMRFLPTKLKANEHEDVVDFFYKSTEKKTMNDLQRIGHYLSSVGFKITSFNRKNELILEISSSVYRYILVNDPKFCLISTEISSIINKIINLPVFFHIQKLYQEPLEIAEKIFSKDQSLLFSVCLLASNPDSFETMSQMNPKDLHEWLLNLQNDNFLEEKIKESINF